jgi:hypothetical protein
MSAGPLADQVIFPAGRDGPIVDVRRTTSGHPPVTLSLSRSLLISQAISLGTKTPKQLIFDNICSRSVVGGYKVQKHFGLAQKFFSFVVIYPAFGSRGRGHSP